MSSDSASASAPLPVLDPTSMPVVATEAAVAEAAAMVDAEIRAATAPPVLREHASGSAVAPVAPPTTVGEVTEGLLPSYFIQLGAEGDTPIDDIMTIPESDLLEALTKLTFLSALQRGKLVREIRSFWVAAGFDPPGLGAPSRKPSSTPSSSILGAPPDAGAPLPGAARPVVAAASAVDDGTPGGLPARTSGADAAGAVAGASGGPSTGAAEDRRHAGPAHAAGAAAQVAVPVDVTVPSILPQTALLEVPLRKYVDQALEGMAKPLTQTQLDKCLDRYRDAFDMDPPESCDPSPEQLAALGHVMGLGLPPYVDFAVFNPYGARLHRITDVDAQIMGSDGVLITKRLHAPSTLEAWEACWKLFAAAMVQLGAASLGALNLYYDGIKLAATQFPARWELIVATDFVVRSEQWPRMRRSCARSTPAGFNAARPWSYVIAAAAYGAEDSPMRDWWNNRFVLPVLTTGSTSAAKTMIAQVEGSAAALGSGGLAAQAGALRQRSRTPRADRGRGRGGRGREQPSKQEQPKELCNLYNAGRPPCAGTLKCPNGRLHRCKWCGDTHPGYDCWPKKDKAKSKGGKNKGGKGGR